MVNDSHYGLVAYISRYRQWAASGAFDRIGLGPGNHRLGQAQGTPTAATSRAVSAASSRSKECPRALRSAKKITVNRNTPGRQ